MALAAIGVTSSVLPAAGMGVPVESPGVSPGAPSVPGNEAVAVSSVLDAVSAMAAMVSSDGVLPMAHAEVAAPSDTEGVFLPPSQAIPPALAATEPVTASLGPVDEVFGPAVGAAAVGPAAGTGPPPAGIGAASVIGPDDRVAVADTAQFPASAVVHVTSDSTHCTGWMVGPDILLTAGHCLHDYAGFVSDLVAIPGRDGASEPFGRCGARRALTTRAFAETGELGEDWGVVELDCRVGERTGWFGLRVADDAIVGRDILVSGYPMDRSRGSQWWAADVVRAAYPGQLAYAGDTYAGQSGSPVYLASGSCAPCGVAVHAYGVGATPDGYNSGSRVTAAVAAVVAALRAR